MTRRLGLLCVALAAAFAPAGCGGGSGSPAEPAAIAPVDSSVFVEATLRPRGSVKADVESLAKNVAGIGDLDGRIVAELEKSAKADGGPFDYAREVEPWLGERAGIFLTGYDGDGFSGSGFIVQTSDADATQEFIDRQARSSREPVGDGSYEGTEYKSEADGTTIGVVGDLLLLGRDLKSFEAAVDAADGESLADAARYSEAIAEVPDGSLASVYVDIGSLVEQAGPIDPQARLFLQTAGIDPSEATATAGVVPGSDQVEIDVSSDLTGENRSAGDASALLGSLPAESSVAFVSPEFGKSLSRAIGNIDTRGIPGQIPPHQLKEALRNLGIDLDQITGSVGDLGAFVKGESKGTLVGAAVLTVDDPSQAKNTVSNIGLLLRAARTPGVTAIGGKASGFSIRSPDLGDKPVVIAAEGRRIAVGYGLPAALLALSGKGPTLSGAADYRAAVSALGGTPIAAFVDAPATLKLAESLVSPEDMAGLGEARPYLSKVAFVAIGGAADGGRTTAKLIVGFRK